MHGLEKLATIRRERKRRDGLPPRPSAAATAAPGMDRPRPRRLPRALLPLAAALAFAALLAWAGGHYLDGRRLTVDAGKLARSEVRRGVFRDYVPVTGAVEAKTTVYLDIAQGGQVAERLVAEGAAVTLGQPLVRFRNAALELQVGSEEAQLAERLFQLSSIDLQIRDSRLQHRRDLATLEAAIEAQARQRDRLLGLAAAGFAKRADLEDAETALMRQRRERETIRAACDLDGRLGPGQTRQLDEAMQSLERNQALARGILADLTVKAPIGGRLVMLDAEVGASKAAGQRIGQIDDESAVQIVAAIDEFYLNRVARGQEAAAEIDGVTYRLEVGRIRPEVRNRQFAVDFDFIGAPPVLRRGQGVPVRLELGPPAEGLILPNGPYLTQGSDGSVFVIAPSGERAERRAVTFGRRSPLAVEVLAGLREGDAVVTSTTRDFDGIDILDIRNASPSTGKGPQS